MTDRSLNIPRALETTEETIARFSRWFEGHTDADGKQHPGLLLMVGELYSDHVLRRERREAFNRAFATGSILAIFGIALTWIKDHIR